MQRRGRSSRLSEADRRIDIVLWVVFFLSAALTLLWAMGPRPPGSGLFPRSDKVFHAVAFAMILGSYLLAAVWRPGRGWGRYPATALPFAVALIAFGLVIELIQSEFLDRDADVLDLAADVGGMVFAVGFTRALGWPRSSARRPAARP